MVFILSATGQMKTQEWGLWEGCGSLKSGLLGTSSQELSLQGKSGLPGGGWGVGAT